MILNIIHGILGTAMGYIIPGYLLSLILFKDIKNIDRLSLGIGLSMCLDIAIGYMLGLNRSLQLLTGGITEFNLWMMLSFLSFIFILIYIKQKKFDVVINVEFSFNKNLAKKITVLLLLLSVVFLTRFLLYTNNPYAGDAYEFKSLYITNQILHKGYIDYDVPLRDAAHKFYTGMIVEDSLLNLGHPIFLAVQALLSKIPLELMRRLSFTTVFLIFPLYSLYRLITRSEKFAPIFVLLPLLYFENILVISGKTANITLAWYLSLCAIYLLISNIRKEISYVLTAIIQIILFLTYKTGAISLLPVLLTITYGKFLIPLCESKKDKNLPEYMKGNLAEPILSSVLFITFIGYYFYFYPLIINVFLGKFGILASTTFLKLISPLAISSALVINLGVFGAIYHLYFFAKYNISKFVFVAKYTEYLKLPILLSYILSLLAIVGIYLSGLKNDAFLITPSTNVQLIKRIIDLLVFFGLFGFAIIYNKKYLSKKLNNLVFYWIGGSLILFPIWFIWGSTYGFVLRAAVVLMFPGSLIVANLFEKYFLHFNNKKILMVLLTVYIISPTLYYMATINILAKGAVEPAEYFGLKWISSNIDKDSVIYSDLRIAGALLPVSDYTHIQLKGPNDFNGVNGSYEGTNFSEELNNVWYTNGINPITNKILTYRNINYIIQTSNYYNEGFMASNFFYKPMTAQTKEAYDSSIFFNKIYSNGELWIYEVR